MGQYYLAIFLAESEETILRAWLSPHNYGNGAKLTEHSYLKNNFLETVMYLLSPDGMFYKSRLVWAGDYADKEPSGKTLYTIANDQEGKCITPKQRVDDSYVFLVNHTKKQFVDLRKVEADSAGYRLHPLALLTAEGNGRGGGDYRGQHEDRVGLWARDILSAETSVPEGYEEFVPDFME